MNDSIIGMAFLTLFGLAMFVVGWEIRNVLIDREYQRYVDRTFRDSSDETTGI